MLLFLHVQSHGNQRVCPEQKCSEVLRWENSKYCTKIKAGRLPETSHHSAGITGSQRIAAKPLQGSQIRPMASGLGCTQLTEWYSYISISKGSSPTLKWMLWIWGLGDFGETFLKSVPIAPHSRFRPQRDTPSAHGQQCKPGALLIPSLGNRLDTGWSTLYFWKLESHWVNDTITHFFKDRRQQIVCKSGHLWKLQFTSPSFPIQNCMLFSLSLDCFPLKGCHCFHLSS